MGFAAPLKSPHQAAVFSVGFESPLLQSIQSNDLGQLVECFASQATFDSSSGRVVPAAGHQSSQHRVLCLRPHDLLHKQVVLLQLCKEELLHRILKLLWVHGHQSSLFFCILRFPLQIHQQTICLSRHIEGTVARRVSAAASRGGATPASRCRRTTLPWVWGAPMKPSVSFHRKTGLACTKLPSRSCASYSLKCRFLTKLKMSAYSSWPLCH